MADEYTPRLKEQYYATVRDELQKQFNYKNVMMIPKIDGLRRHANGPRVKHAASKQVGTRPREAGNAVGEHVPAARRIEAGRGRIRKAGKRPVGFISHQNREDAEREQGKGEETRSDAARKGGCACLGLSETALPGGTARKRAEQDEAICRTAEDDRLACAKSQVFEQRRRRKRAIRNG